MSTPAKLSSYLRAQEFVAFDTETTGIWAPVNRIVEIGAVKFRLNQTEHIDFQTLVNPERPMPEEVIKIHGITDQMVSKAPNIKTALNDFISFCGDAVMIAHNASFDISFIATESERSELNLPGNQILDTIEIFKKFFPGLKSYSLLALAHEFSLAKSQTHRALDDARLVRLLLEHASEKLSKMDSMDQLLTTLAASRFSDWNATEVLLPPPYQELQKAVKDKLRVTIQYRHPDRRADQPEDWRTIKVRQAYRLGSRYYLNAFCEKAGGERTFRLDRIENYTLLDD